MNDKFIISSVLTDLTLSSKIKFIEAKGNEDLIKLAKSKGIDLPSPDLACFETYYCELDKPNLNNAMLTKKAAEEGINSLIGKQINLNHLGKNYVIGYTIDAKIKDDLVVVTGILFKSLFFEEFDEIKELFSEGKLFVSFELWNREPITGDSLIEEMDNGIKKITKMIAHGVGLLLTGIKPACKKAQVFKLLANQKDNGELIFQEDERFACATLNSKEECNQCKICLCEKEEIKLEEIKLEEILDNDYEDGEIEEAKKLTTEQRNALPDSDFALIQERDGKKIRRFPINDETHVRNALARLPQAKDITEEEKKSALAKILKKAKELNMTELLKKYEKADEIPAQVIPEPAQVVPPVVEVKPEPAQVAEAPVGEQKEKEKPIRTVSYYTTENIESVGEDGGVDYQSKSYEKIIRTYKDGHEEIEIREGTSVNDSKISKYTSAQLEEAVKKAKEELATLHATELEAKTNEVKSDLEKKITEKETEISNLKKELDAKAQEIAELTKPKVEVAKEEPTIEVGNVETKDNNPTKKEAEEINKIIASKHKR